ncbi:MAG: extracellular solute-binding protein [Proteobacteria bacterium]|nr:extracellular solute-binding protein [Pseudomonadota bacterium]MBU1687252.1 extracellular solute-binding protein [Pseudomonadota bacterium]
MRSYHYYLIAIIALGVAIGSCSESEKKAKNLLFLSGAGMKVPVNEIAANFERETGIKVQTHFDGSSILRDYILQFNTGDIFLPGDKKNLDILAKKGLVLENNFIAWHVVAILVSPEAKDRIKGLDDLAEPGVRIVMSNPKLASLGQIVMTQVIEKHPRRNDILKNIVVYGSSSQDVLKLYRGGGIDAIIEWDVMAATPAGEGLIVVPLEPPYQVKDELHTGLLTTAGDPTNAKKFYAYLTTKGKEVFRKHGYNTSPL